MRSSIKVSTRIAGSSVMLFSGLAYGLNDYGISADISGVESWGFQGDPQNQVFMVELLGAGATVTQISWDLNLTTLGISWADEATMTFTDIFGTELSIIAGAGDSFTVTNMNYSGSVSAGVALNATYPLTLEFHEIGFDDNIGSPDAIYEAGSELVFFVGGFEAFVKLTPIPGPGTSTCLMVGLCYASKRRRSYSMD